MMRKLATLAVLCIMSCATAASPQTFAGHGRSFPTGPNVTSIVAADLNGDGIPEIIAANRGRLSDLRDERPADNQLSFLLGVGDLVWKPQPQLRTGFGPYHIQVVHDDPSKAPDLLVANFMAPRNSDLTLLRNLGGNLFEPLNFSLNDDALHYTKMRDGDGEPVFNTPGLTSVIAGDFDGDGYRDAIATGWSSDVLAYFPGTADTIFAQAELYPVEGGPRDVQAADFDGDGDKDLAVLLYNAGEIAIFEGGVENRFRLHSRFSSRGRLPVKIRVADMNGDSKPDLIVAHSHSEDSIVIFYGDGDLNFSLSQEITLGKERGVIEHEIRDIVVAEFTGDGIPDVAIACFASRKVVLLASTGPGNAPFGYRTESYRFKTGRPRALFAADLNGDNRLDLGVALWERNVVELLLAK